MVLEEGDIRVRYTIINWNGVIISKACEQTFSNEFPRKDPSYLHPLLDEYVYIYLIVNLHDYSKQHRYHWKTNRNINNRCNVVFLRNIDINYILIC